MDERFVIHEHRGHGPTHFDLMLSCGEALATWQVSRRPAELRPAESMPARRLADHRTAYLEYEGPVSGGRGEVRRIDTGSYERIAAGWQIRMDGAETRGTFELTQVGTGQRSDRDEEAWLLRRIS